MRFNPFNPQLPARPDFFVGRQPEIIEFEKLLSQTIHNSPMNLSVTGNRGMGKTSILVKFEQITKDNGGLVLRLSNYEGNVTNIMDLADYISSNLKRELLSKRPLNKHLVKAKDWAATFKPTLSWKEFTLSIEKQQVVQEIFRRRLIDLWKEIRKEYNACVILIDEAESLEKIKGALTFLREVFQRLGTDANLMVVLAGKLNFPERMSESFSPLNRFFPCSRLAPFGREEIKTYIKKRLSTVDVKIDDNALDFICRKSQGHPYVLVAMAYLLFDSLRPEEDKITGETTERAQEKIFAKLSQDFFSPMYHPLTPNAKNLIKTICKHTKTQKFSFSDAVKWMDIDGNYVSPYIQELLIKGIINKPSRGKYVIFHQLFMDYVKMLKKL